MRKLFRIYAAQGGHSAELELPATDHELLDLMERLRLGPGQSPYLAIQEYLEPDYSYDYLSGYIQNPPDLLQLNALARRLEGLDTHGAAAFEGFVTMDIQKGETPIPLQYLGGAMTPYGLLEKKDAASLISERDHQKNERNGDELMNREYTYLASLPGTQEEQTWLRDRLEALSVWESAALAALNQRCPPNTAEEMVNRLPEDILSASPLLSDLAAGLSPEETFSVNLTFWEALNGRGPDGLS